jgi:hypothetical protein
MQSVDDSPHPARGIPWAENVSPHTGNHTWRVTTWEVHPVTRIEVWDDEHQTWQLVPSEGVRAGQKNTLHKMGPLKVKFTSIALLTRCHGGRSGPNWFANGDLRQIQGSYP